MAGGGREGREAREARGEREESAVRSRTSVDGGRRYEETLVQRQELEEARRENEILRQRVKELEKLVREKREGSGAGATDGGDRG